MKDNEDDYIITNIGDFIQLKLKNSKTIHIKNMYIPFGLNENNTIKLEFPKTETTLFHKIDSIDKKHFDNAIQILEGKYKHISKLKEKGHYPSTIMCKIPHKKSIIQTKITSKIRSELYTIFTLKRRTVNAIIEKKDMWIINNELHSVWYLTECEVL